MVWIRMYDCVYLNWGAAEAHRIRLFRKANRAGDDCVSYRLVQEAKVWWIERGKGTRSISSVPEAAWLSAAAEYTWAYD